jgi:hypothetical protein
MAFLVTGWSMDKVGRVGSLLTPLVDGPLSDAGCAAQFDLRRQRGDRRRIGEDRGGRRAAWCHHV